MRSQRCPFVSMVAVAVQFGCAAETDSTRESQSNRNGGSAGDTFDETRAALWKAGVHGFAEVREKGVDRLATETGVSTSALEEIATHADWLDTPGVSFAQAKALVQAGAPTPADYLAADTDKQRELAAVLPPHHLQGVPASASHAAPPSPPRGVKTVGLDPSYFCSAFEPPARTPACSQAGASAARSPYIDWCWQRGPSQTPISDRPWCMQPATGYDPQNPCAACQNGRADCQRWHPNPAQGWDLLAYNFGGPQSADSRDFGYVLFHNNYLGLLRLFVLVNPESGGSRANGVTALLNLETCAPTSDGRDCVSWNRAGTYTFASQLLTNPRSPFSEMDNATVSWSQSYANGSTMTPGSWLRADIPVFNDPQLSQMARSSAVRMRILIAALDIANESGTMAGTSQMSGTAVSAAGSRGAALASGDLSVAKDLVFGAVGAASSGSEIQSSKLLGFLGIAGTAASVLGGIGAVGMAAGFLSSFFGEATPQRFDINLKGTFSGRYAGTSVAITNGADHYFILEPSAPVFLNGARIRPQFTQRCRSTRLGSFGVRTSLTQMMSQRTIPVLSNYCSKNRELVFGTSGWCPNYNDYPRPNIRVGTNGRTVSIPTIFDGASLESRAPDLAFRIGAVQGASLEIIPSRAAALGEETSASALPLWDMPQSRVVGQPSGPWWSNPPTAGSGDQTPAYLGDLFTIAAGKRPWGGTSVTSPLLPLYTRRDYTDTRTGGADDGTRTLDNGSSSNAPAKLGDVSRAFLRTIVQVDVPGIPDPQIISYAIDVTNRLQVTTECIPRSLPTGNGSARYWTCTQNP